MGENAALRLIDEQRARRVRGAGAREVGQGGAGGTGALRFPPGFAGNLKQL